MVGISKTEVGDSLGLLLGAIGARRFRQPMAPSLPPSKICAGCLVRWPKPAIADNHRAMACGRARSIPMVWAGIQLEV
jgi:hypothetical protein